MKKICIVHFLVIVLAWLPKAVLCQLDVHNNGKITIGGIPMSPQVRPACKTFINGDVNSHDLVVEHRNLTNWSYGVKTILPNKLNTTYLMECTDPATPMPSGFYVVGEGWIYCAGTYYSSDSSLKKKIIKLQSPLTQLNKIGGYTYYFKPVRLKTGRDSGKLQYPDTMQHMGVLAQEIEAIAPYAVKTLENGTKAVDYNQLIPLLIESIKELDKKRKDQQDEMELMKARYNKLASSIDTAGGVYKLTGAKASSYFILYQNSPNPFSQKTTISYNLSGSYSSAYIYVFDLNGGLKKTFSLSGSSGSVTINGSDLTPGMYLYSLVVDGNEIDVKRMVLTN